MKLNIDRSIDVFNLVTDEGMYIHFDAWTEYQGAPYFVSLFRNGVSIATIYGEKGIKLSCMLNQLVDRCYS